MGFDGLDLATVLRKGRLASGWVWAYGAQGIEFSDGVKGEKHARPFFRMGMGIETIQA